MSPLISTVAMDHDPSSPLVTVARYDAAGDAQLAKTRLQDAGIPCMIANEDQSGLTTMFDFTKGGVEVKVAKDRLDDAREALDVAE